MLNGDRWREMWNSLDEETRERIRAKAKWEHMTLPAVIRDWWLNFAQDSAVIQLYQERNNGWDGQCVIGHVDGNGNTLMRTKTSWQRKYPRRSARPGRLLRPGFPGQVRLAARGARGRSRLDRSDRAKAWSTGMVLPAPIFPS